jgi:hypothetical protein
MTLRHGTEDRRWVSPGATPQRPCWLNQQASESPVDSNNTWCFILDIETSTVFEVVFPTKRPRHRAADLLFRVGSISDLGFETVLLRDESDTSPCPRMSETMRHVDVRDIESCIPGSLRMSDPAALGLRHTRRRRVILRAAEHLHHPRVVPPPDLVVIVATDGVLGTSRSLQHPVLHVSFDDFLAPWSVGWASDTARRTLRLPAPTRSEVSSIANGCFSLRVRAMAAALAAEIIQALSLSSRVPRSRNRTSTDRRDVGCRHRDVGIAMRS